MPETTPDFDALLAKGYTDLAALRERHRISMGEYTQFGMDLDRQGRELDALQGTLDRITADRAAILAE